MPLADDVVEKRRCRDAAAGGANWHEDEDAIHDSGDADEDDDEEAATEQALVVVAARCEADAKREAMAQDK